MAIQVVILAAGQGKRMHSSLPKGMHLLAGKPLLEHVISKACAISSIPFPIVVYGHQAQVLHENFSHYSLQWVLQKEQLGTGHALLQTLPHLAKEDHVLVLYGDVPLISIDILRQLIETTPQNAIGLLTADWQHPGGYGRIKRDSQNRVIQIVEEKEATLEELAITEINPAIYFLPVTYLKKWLPQLTRQNAQQEYYLTDIITFAVREKIVIHAVKATVPEEILGVNDRAQLSFLERFYQRQLAEKWMHQWVTIYDPARLDIRGEVEIGADTSLDVNVILEGRVVIGKGCTIGPNTILRHTVLGDYVEVKANSIIDGAEIAEQCVIGPYARIRPGTVLSSHVHIGNFVEIKNSEVGRFTKINHLSYIGDSEIGKQVNVGAGTITCNYDGFNKHKTVIGDEVHIGSDTQLVAPITIGEGATIGAGSTVTKDVPKHQLTITHQLTQRYIKDWQRPKKKEDME